MHQWDKKQEFLNEVNSPADVKNLSVPELKKLAEEIRRFILGSVSKTGGHLASNLGVVELTLAMHYVFDFKHDKLLWDVGHQCYAHKIITGRKEKFKDLRRAEGISGFPNPAESEYDQFSVGHAGTSIATAIGMALGQKKQDKDDRVVAVVGDASIVNGASFEALNNLGLVKRQLLIVLNDNSMAIDVTVGAMAKYFLKIRLSHTYDDLRRTTRNILEHMPVIGKSVEEAIERLKKGIRMALPASQMFESMNIPYFGPVDGHDVGSLIQLFEALVDLNHPAILHVYTKKGKGFEPADQGPSKFHSTGPFKMNGVCVEPESASDTRRSFTGVLGEQLTELAQKDDRIVAITSAMCDGTGLVEFSKKFADRFYDVGIAESAAVDIAAGLARSGLRPVVCIYSTFLQRSFDQIFQEVALQGLPVVFCIDRAGLVGSDGPTHHGLMDIGFLRLIPNMVLTAPANDIEMRGALEFALGQDKPVVIRYPKDFVPEQKFVRAACASPFVLGKSVLVKRSKKSTAVIVSYGSILTEALKAAETLAQDGIAVNVINGRFAGPVDEKIVSLPDKGKVVITVEDHALACGFGSAVLELAAAKNRSIKAIRVLGVPDRFIGHDSRSHQLMEAGINADKIVETVKEMLSVRKPKIEIRSIKQSKSAKTQKSKSNIVNV
ncbi:MAG: 1-deoxy-D-xylulose-5-phosphate synthase [Planctomycetes bacterium]|nr:1-deoxy-D-xylulose-5-phosphate synthase [Planctomycetota bacterium]MBL7144312.1 1-deoxy-D-xylulose-5-phosphate synthase [Phycisphaerae bacterium]